MEAVLSLEVLHLMYRIPVRNLADYLTNPIVSPDV